MKRFKRIYLEITNNCNLSCSFCPPHSRAPRNLSTDEYRNILDKIEPYTNYLYLHVKGEPLLHKDLGFFLTLAEEKKIHVQITTNGTLLDKSFDTWKDSESLRQINISLHSFAFHRSIDLESYMKTVMEKADYFSQNTNTIVSLRLWNLDQAIAQRELYKENHQVLALLQQHYTLSKDDLLKSIGNRHGIKLAHNIYLNSDYEFQWPALSNDTYDQRGTCQGLKSQLGILSDGTVIPCCLDSDGIISLGNILREELEDILAKERTVQILEGFKKNILTEELCKHCSYRRRFDK